MSSIKLAGLLLDYILVDTRDKTSYPEGLHIGNRSSLRARMRSTNSSIRDDRRFFNKTVGNQTSKFVICTFRVVEQCRSEICPCKLLLTEIYYEPPFFFPKQLTKFNSFMASP